MTKRLWPVSIGFIGSSFPKGRSRGGHEEVGAGGENLHKDHREEGEDFVITIMPPSKGRDSLSSSSSSSSLLLINRDLQSQLQFPSSRREVLPPTGSKGKALGTGSRKSSSWKNSLGSSWKPLKLSLILLILCGLLLIISQVFDDQLGGDTLAGGLPGLSAISVIEEQKPNVAAHGRRGLRLVRDIVAFPDEVMLLVKTDPNTPIPDKNSLQCLFGEKERTDIYTIEWKDDSKTILAVRCQNPSRAVNQTEFATLIFADENVPLLTAVQNTTNSSWTPLVYETLTLHDSVLLFAKGLVDSQGRPNNHSKELGKLHCSFGGQFEDELGARFSAEVKTRVIVISQEVVRCELPPLDRIQQLRGLPVSLFVPRLGKLRTVAYFNVPERFMTPPKPDENPQEKRFFVCACTMLWNQADFLREWIMYHGFLGIEKWFLYDNNSDDDIVEVLDTLSSDYNVSRIPWPWIKTQEAGFSHCALRAKADCKWVLFADVDEFVYPSLDLHVILSEVSEKGARNSINLAKNQSSEALPKIAFPVTGDSKKKPSLQAMSNYLRNINTTIVRTLIERTVSRGLRENKKVGEVRLVCHNFGPSNLVAAPDEGVTVGYTCRSKRAERHKSFVLLDAMSDTLLNVVHHFKLADGYRQMPVHVRLAVINHYKFQAWEVFKAKFVRRVATYVADWKSTNKTSFSNDVTPGLGSVAIEPVDWPSKFCEEEDHGLRNFTLTYFRKPESPDKMLWHLDGRVSQLQKQRDREAQQRKSTSLKGE
ncbi:hypothetical protein R1flu_007483 [Riccia fluitans]|uniref:Glycosyltransferase family 92 protein n=1 Tax=Riccia fluitans TaxID=41844 RepID=A0ABD1YZ01_9MARC